MSKHTKQEEVEIIDSSGNVYEDLGIKNPEEWATKARLASKIYDIIEARDLTQVEAAEILGIKQPDVSVLCNGHFGKFSVYRLLSFLRTLDQDVDIIIRPKTRKTAHIHVAEA